MKMKKLALACGLALTAIAGTSQAEVSANVALTSDYVFRGISQTQEDPAIQGGFDYSHESGFYAGTWASNVESDPDANINYDSASMEIDFYAGWSGALGPVGVDVGALRYQYPGTNTSANNTNEFHVGVGKDFGVASADFTVNYSTDFFGAGKAYYYDFGLEVPVQSVTLAAHYGITKVKDDSSLDYDDWSIGASTEVGGFGFDLSYHNTDIDDLAEADGRVVLTISKSM